VGGNIHSSRRGVWFFAFRCAQCHGQVRPTPIRVHNGRNPSVWWKRGQIVAAPQEIGIPTAARILDALTIHDETNGIAHFEKGDGQERLHA